MINPELPSRPRDFDFANASCSWRSCRGKKTRKRSRPKTLTGRRGKDGERRDGRNAEKRGGAFLPLPPASEIGTATNDGARCPPPPPRRSPSPSTPKPTPRRQDVVVGSSSGSCGAPARGSASALASPRPRGFTWTRATETTRRSAAGSRRCAGEGCAASRRPQTAPTFR